MSLQVCNEHPNKIERYFYGFRTNLMREMFRTYFNLKQHTISRSVKLTIHNRNVTVQFYNLSLNYFQIKTSHPKLFGMCRRSIIQFQNLVCQFLAPWRAAMGQLVEGGILGFEIVPQRCLQILIMFTGKFLIPLLHLSLLCYPTSESCIYSKVRY